jgi:hypothetical protein
VVIPVHVFANVGDHRSPARVHSLAALAGETSSEP